MKKLVLVEENHLIRLGLHKLFSSLSNEWEIVSLDVNEIHELSDADRTADFVVLGLPSEASESCKAVVSIEQVLNPTNMLLLSEHPESWNLFHGDAHSICACIDKKAGTDTLIAAVQLGMRYEKDCSGHAETALEQKPSQAQLLHAPITSNCESAHYERMVAQDRQQPDAMDDALPSDLLAEESISTQSLDKHGEASDCGAKLLNITPRQYQVLELLARGYPIKTVARMMDIATATAKAHTSSLYRQLNVNSRGEAVYAARQKGALLN